MSDLFNEGYLENQRQYMRGWQLPSTVGGRTFIIYRGPEPMRICELHDDGRVEDVSYEHVPDRFRRAPECAHCGDARHKLTRGEFIKVPCPECASKEVMG